MSKGFSDHAVLLRVRHFAALADMPVSSAYAAIARGEIKVVRIGRRGIRVPRAVIDQLQAEAMTPNANRGE